MVDTRSQAQHHRDARAKLLASLPKLRQALVENDGLEWSGAIEEIIKETEHVAAKLEQYATLEAVR